MMTPEKAERIARMFVEGYSLDLVSEEGVINGWTRADARAVVTARGWALDWQGRLQTRYCGTGTEVANMAEADAERMLAVGIDHPLVEIRRLAVKAERAISDLRRALILQEEIDAEEVAARRAAKAETDAEHANPKNWDHGTWGAYLKHHNTGVPMCAQCQVVGDRYLAYARRTSSSKRHEKALQPA